MFKRLSRSGENGADLMNRVKTAHREESKGRPFAQDGMWA
ncbi:hypothetical protein Tco_0917942, partial [Tanacetum coccineum]